MPPNLQLIRQSLSVSLPLCVCLFLSYFGSGRASAIRVCVPRDAGLAASSFNVTSTLILEVSAIAELIGAKRILTNMHSLQERCKMDLC